MAPAGGRFFSPGRHAGPVYHDAVLGPLCYGGATKWIPTIPGVQHRFPIAVTFDDSGCIPSAGSRRAGNARGSGLSGSRVGTAFGAANGSSCGSAGRRDPPERHPNRCQSNSWDAAGHTSHVDGDGFTGFERAACSCRADTASSDGADSACSSRADLACTD